MLGNGATGMVVSVNTTKPLRPMGAIHDPSVPREEAIWSIWKRRLTQSVSRALRPTQLSPEAHAYLSPRKVWTYYFDSES